MSSIGGTVIAVGFLCAPIVIYVVRSPTKLGIREVLETISGGLLLFFVIGSVVGLAVYLFPPQNRLEIGTALMAITWLIGCIYAWRLAGREQKERSR